MRETRATSSPATRSPSAREAPGRNTTNSSPADPPEDVPRTHRLPHRLGDVGEQDVPEEVPEAVVDRLEIVDVHHEEAAGPHGRVLLEPLVDQALDDRAVVKPRHRVALGGIPQAQALPLFPVDVRRAPDRPRRRPSAPQRVTPSARCQRYSPPPGCRARTQRGCAAFPPAAPFGTAPAGGGPPGGPCPARRRCPKTRACASGRPARCARCRGTIASSSAALYSHSTPSDICATAW